MSRYNISTFDIHLNNGWENMATNYPSLGPYYHHSVHINTESNDVRSFVDTNITGNGNTSAYGISDEDKPYYKFYDDARFITGLICYPILCFFGLLGNILILIVFSRKSMSTSTNIYLSALAVSDIIKLINDLLYFLTVLLTHTYPDHGNKAFGYLYPYAHFVFNMSVCVSSWLTVSVAVERYILVCHPTRAKGIISIPRAKLISILCFIIMTSVAIPSALRYKTVKITTFEDGRNITRLDVNLTELWENEKFVVSYNWLQSLLRSIIPLFILVFMNAFIINALRKTRANKKNASRNRITVMLIIVIIFFLCCITPDAIMSAFFKVGYTESDNYLVKGVREITDMLLAVNAAMNIILYVVFNKIFRDQFIELFHPCCCCVCSVKDHTNTSQKSKNYVTDATASMNNGKNGSGYHKMKLKHTEISPLDDNNEEMDSVDDRAIKNKNISDTRL